MRVVVHEELNPKSAYSVLCHELGHILLGHLGTDRDQWWPSRPNLSNATVEIEAEAVSYMVAVRAGLQTASAAYLASYMQGGKVPESVSVDLICKVSGKIQEMGQRLLPEKKSRQSSQESLWHKS